MVETEDGCNTPLKPCLDEKCQAYKDDVCPEHHPSICPIGAKIYSRRLNDTELVLVALLRGVVKWQPFKSQLAPGGELIVRGIRYVADLDTYGLPHITNNTREALTTALGR